MKAFFLQPIEDIASCLERQFVSARSWRQVALRIAISLTSFVACWFIYVPIHELLHVAGCVITGGSVSELQIAAKYGAALLAKVFPFVVTGGDYAGRLTGFDTKGSDFIYFATDFLPFVLSILFGVPLVKYCTYKGNRAVFGIAMVVGFAPIYNLLGDYYEMGSTLTTRFITIVARGGGPPMYAGIRSDDVFRLIEELTSNGTEESGDSSREPPPVDAAPDPGDDPALASGDSSREPPPVDAAPDAGDDVASLPAVPASTLATIALIAASFLMGVLLALGTYWAGCGFARLIVKPPVASESAVGSADGAR
ncbi:MAG: hypothetical protein IID36_03645 [Planctomycetes bacterium]|nr:hypothetical protein [Planctomycetota bacterium]